MAGGPAWRDDGAVDEATGAPGDPEPFRRQRRHGLLSRLHDRGDLGPLRRSQGDRLVGGVAAGVARRTGFDVNVVRLVFVLAMIMSGGGLGAGGYVLAWLLIPAEGGEASIASQARTDRRGIALAAGLGSLVVVMLLIAGALGARWISSVAWPLVISAAGLVLIWRNSAEDERVTIRRLTEPLLGLTTNTGRSRTVIRLAVAGVLLIGGIWALVSAHQSIAVLRPLAGGALVIAAVVVVLGPWWLRIARDLVIERQARIRAEERADMASRVHDSVLQTLALVQKHAAEPQRVIQYARAQERELRAWLFDGQAPGSMGDGMTLAAGVRLIQQDVEAQHGMTVEAVTVGDCELDDDLAALLAAAREATVNAAKWSGAEVVSVFAEVEAAEVSLFVRDRGRGFDPAAVPPDRRGLAESVHARMTRRGGSVTVRSVPGEGTEVSLTMPRAAGRRQPSRA
jgi:signal transduction histidine kinase